MNKAGKSNGRVWLILRRGLLLTGIPFLIGLAFILLATTVFPSIGAHGADTLRSIVGDPAVAQLETWVYRSADIFHQVVYSLGIEKPAAPWQAPASPAPLETATLSPSPGPTPTAPTTSTPIAISRATPVPTRPPTRTATSTPSRWLPAAVHPLGTLQGEGSWQAYIEDGKGNPVAYRTFLQPDPARPYSLVAVVAFDLTRTRLNFILGSEEPSLKGGPRGTGVIPPGDALPETLLATFNGGFKAEHGKYGAMSGGVVAIPPRENLATVVLYKDGSVKIGSYGKEIISLDNAAAWRQNCSLVIDHGQIDPLVYNDSAVYWGANLNGETVIWRSGLGISPDGKTLYYFAGPNLRMRVLAAAMQAVHVEAGLQLDINNYWVFFAAIRDVEGIAVPEPLFPDEMKSDVGRYLTRYSRDFFYVTLRKNPAP